MDHVVEIAQLEILRFSDGDILNQFLCANRSWHRTVCALDTPSGGLFEAACLQRWPWLAGSLAWSQCSHHLWQRYLGSWRSLYQDRNRANAVCSLEVVVRLDDPSPCVQGPWVQFPERNLSLRVNIYPAGNRRWTSSHLSAYLEVRAPKPAPPAKPQWHAALDFTLVGQRIDGSGALVGGETCWSSGPVRFLEQPGGQARLDWGCHEFLAAEKTVDDGRDRSGEPQTARVRAHVALQEAVVEVVHMDWLKGHADDFGLCAFQTFQPQGQCQRDGPVRLGLASSTTKAELMEAVSRAVGSPATHLWSFSRSLNAPGNRFVCNLPEAPRHLAAAHGEQGVLEGVHALLTKWTLGESAGSVRQNFFRLLAESRKEPAPAHRAAGAPRLGPTPAHAGAHVSVFLKMLQLDGTVRFHTMASLPVADNAAQLLPEALRAAGRRGSPVAAWCLIREGSPSDWAEELPAEDPSRVVNCQGFVMEGDILVLCPRAELPRVSAMYRARYEERVASFRGLLAREREHTGSVRFTELCHVMDRLNVDVWRLEQLFSSISQRTAQPVLALMLELPGLHPQFFCDDCGTRELRGCRYNCQVCSDFDLCANCGAPGARCPSSKRDHQGRCHEHWHPMAKVQPALPVGCAR